jgi:magnesium transporter
VLDDRALRWADRVDLLNDLVRLRHRIGRIRRTLAPQREVFAALARPSFEILAASDSAAHLRTLQDRLERAIGAVENARELLLGSFDLYMTQTAGARTT